MLTTSSMLMQRCHFISHLSVHMKRSLIFLFTLVAITGYAQSPDHNFAANIKTIKFSLYGDPMGYPVLKLNSGDRLELNFDDLDANVKNYSYTFQLCNADWLPAQLEQL